MVSLLVALVMSGQSPLDRFFNRMDSAKSFQTNFVAKIDGRQETAKGTFAIRQPARLKFVAHSGPSKYVYAAGPHRTIEYESALKRAAEYAPSPVAAPPDSRVSGTADFWFPTILMLRERNQLRVPDRAITYGKSAVGGRAVDVVRATNEGMIFEFTIDSEGKLLSCVWPQNTGDGVLAVRFEFNDIVFNAPLPESFFDLSAPAGFEAVAAPRELYPLNAGDEFPNVWVNRATQRAENVWHASGNSLVVAASTDEATIARAAPFIKQLRAITTVITMDERGALISTLKEFRHLYDPTGRAYERLRAPGTPAFYVLDSEGRILKFQLGFDAKRSAEFLSEFRKSLDATR